MALLALQSARAAPGDTVADYVFGQGGSFTSNACNNGGVSAASLCTPIGAAVDSSGRLYIADFDNNRVLEYDNPLVANPTADRVFGQAGSFSSTACNNGGVSASSLCGPIGLWVDSGGRLYVADFTNSRVLEYDSPLTSQVATRVFGQPDFVSSACNSGGRSASTLCTPEGVKVDSAGHLWIADKINHRVLEYDSPLTSQVATYVIGAPNFATGGCTATDAMNVCFPEDVAIDTGGNVYVADYFNNRIVEFNTPLTTDRIADRVFGQGGSFTTNTCNNGGISASSICTASGLALDASGRLYVREGATNARVLVYDTPLTSQVANRVFGQGGSFTTNTCNNGGISASSLCADHQLALDGSGNVYITDSGNNRVLEYDNPTPPTPPPTTPPPTTPPPTPPPPTGSAGSTFKPVTGVKFCNDLPASFPPDPGLAGGGGTCSESAQPASKGLIVGANPDITTTLDMASGDLNFTNVVTLAPANQIIAGGGSMAPGVKLGGLHSETRLGVFNAPCNVLFPVDFVFFNVALPNLAGAGGRVDTSTNIAWPQPEGTPVRFGRWQVGSEPAAGGGTAITTSGFGANVADGTNLAIQNYPHHLVRAFDRDTVPADGGLDSLLPLAVYGGLTRVAGTEWVPLYFVQFAAGGLSALSQPLSSLVANMGQPSVSVLNDPTATAASPSIITDFCTPLNVTTMLLGDTGSGFRITNPGTAGTQYHLQYNASLRDTDQDSYENSLDTCPLNVNVRNPRLPAGAGDVDNDGIDASCDPNDAVDENSGDFDLDGFKNRQDNCPLVSNVLQTDSELSSGPAADKGPRTDQIGDACDSEGGTKSFIQNCSATCGSGVSITMSDTVGNGRYMTVTNVVAKCIEAALPIDQDVDGDGYCIAQDSADSGVCATQSPPSCFTRHNQWAGAAFPALQMDTDGDKQSDALETYVGTDPVQSCSWSSVNNNEPMDNWMFDLTDNLLVNGGDSGQFSTAFNKNVVNGPFGSPLRPGVRYDFNSDGFISGQDTGKFGGSGPYTGGKGPFNMSCSTAGIPPFGQQ